MKFSMYHSCITVLDIDKSVKFYEEALGMHVARTKEGEDYKLVFMATPDDSCRLELTWYKERKEPYNLGDNEIHIGFHVDDFEAAKKLHSDMDVICFDNPEFGIYFIEDPDGYWMEIVPEKKS